MEFLLFNEQTRILEKYYPQTKNSNYFRQDYIIFSPEQP